MKLFTVMIKVESELVEFQVSQTRWSQAWARLETWAISISEIMVSVFVAGISISINIVSVFLKISLCEVRTVKIDEWIQFDTKSQQ